MTSMANEKHNPHRDRQIVFDDFKKRLYSLLDNTQELPPVAWDAEPLRYFKLNQEWCRLLFGWVEIMEEVGFWPDADDELYEGIQGILKFEVGIELPDGGDMSCDDVEDCLETSTIINNINIDIGNITNIVNELEYEQKIGDLDLPATPAMADAGNAVCRGANFIALRLKDALLASWAAATDLSIEEGVSVLIAINSWGFTPSVQFWQYVFTLSNPDLADNAVTYQDNIAQAFFCSNWDLALAMDFIQADPDIPSNEKALWIVTLEKFVQSQIDEWGSVGSLSSSDFDCTSGCPWAVIWVFDEGSYTPEEGDTVYGLGSWTLNDAELIDTGYASIDGDMDLTHTLPEQCRVTGVSMRCGKHNACGQLRWRHTTTPKTRPSLLRFP